MKILILYLAVLGFSSAVPNGYYHQEYNYKTSSSSFKNNELQHKTDDQGYYRKDGDLDGRVKPVVDANSEHTEYVNPNSQSGQYHGDNTDFSSAGNMRAQSGYSGYGSNALDAEGFARSGRIIGSGGYSSGYSSGYGTNSIGSTSQSYGTSSNLRLITTRLQQELQSELQEAIRQNNIYPQARVDIAELERELRQNLTERLNNELTARFGQQTVRGGLSYTITGGRLQSTANYDNEELSNLRRQLEDSLMNQLRTLYSSSGSSSSFSSSSHYNSQGRYGYTTTVRPVSHQVYHSLPSYTSTVRYPVDYNHANYQTIRYTPVTTPETITSIASRIQTQLDARLNDVLDETREKYFSSSSAYSLTNTDVLLERIRNELRSNLTYLLDEDIRRNYGTQIQRDGYSYSLGPSGQTSTDYNYSLRDLENLKQQVERNLIEKLNRDFETYRARWSSRQSYSSQSSYGSNYQYSSTPRYDYKGSQRYEYTTPRYEVFTTPRQSYVNSYPISAAHQNGYIQTGGSASNQYEYASGSQQSGYGMQSSGSIAQLQRQLQDDLSRQLRGALQTGHYSSYSSDGVSNAQNYRTTLQQLSDELNRNLTKHLQEYSAMGSYAAYGNFDNAQMQRLKSQLQDSLMNQLQQSLQQSYQTSSSYSSSSSSSSNSNYRPVRGFQNYQGGQYRSGIETVAGEDCSGDDPNTHNHIISKRSLRFANGYEKQGQLLGFGSNIYQRGPSHHVQHPIEVGQEVDDYDTTQQLEDSGLEKFSNYGQGQDHIEQHTVSRNHAISQRGQDQIDVGQLIDDLDLIQPIEDHGYGKFFTHGQQIDDSDLTQQIDDTGYGRLQVLNHGQEIVDSYLTQQIGDTSYGKLPVPNHSKQIDDSDLTQQIEDTAYGKLQIPNHGQQIDDSDLTQQTEDTAYGKLQVPNHGQQIDDSDLTQQIEVSGYGKLQVPNHSQQIDDSDLTQQIEVSGYRKFQDSNHGQQIDDSDLTQQIENTAYGKLQSPNHGQRIDDSDLTQQIEVSGYGKLQVPNHGQQIDDSDSTQQIEVSGYRKFQDSNHGQQIDDSDSTQQIEDNAYGKLQSPNHGQRIDDSDLTQQIEDTGYGKLQVSNHGQQIDDSDLTQQIEVSGYRKFQASNHGQQIDDSDSTQQIEDTAYGKLQRPNHGQQIYDSDLTQQIEDTAYGKLQVPNHGQQIDDSDLTQQIEVSGYRKFQASNHGQQIDDSDLTQQVEDTAYGKLQVPNHSQQIDDSDLTQQIEDNAYGRLQVPNHGQQIDDSDLTQQIEDTAYGKLQVPNYGQQTDDSDLTQQIEDTGYDKLQVPNNGQQIVDSDLTQQIVDSDLTQQIEDTGNGKLRVPNHGQQIDDSDLTQQVEESGYRKWQMPNPSQKVNDFDLNQQVEDPGYGILQVSNHGNPIGDSSLIQQVEDSGNGKLQIPNHNQVENSDLTQHVDQSGYEQLQNPSISLPDQNINNYDLNQEKIEQSGYRRYDIPSVQKLELGQEVDNLNFNQESQHAGVGNQRPQYPVQTEQEVERKPFGNVNVGEQTQLIDTETVHQHRTDHKQQEIEHPEVTQYRPIYQPGTKPETQDSNGISPNGKQPLNSQFIAQEQISESAQKVGDTRPIEPEAGTLNHQKPQGLQGQQFEVPQIQTTEREEAVHKNNNQVSEFPEYGTDTEGEWCSKYIDVSIMDAPWQLSSKLKDEIRNQFNKLQNDLEKPHDTLYQKILSELPKGIMYTCFHVNDMKLNQREKDQVIKGLEDYFKSLIKQEITDLTTQKPKKVSEFPEYGTEDIEGEWCSRYIDVSIMDAPWQLSSQLKDEIRNQYNKLQNALEKPEDILYQKILSELPKRIMYTCFHVNNMKLSQREEDQVIEGLEDYFRSLIKKEIIDIITKNSKKVKIFDEGNYSEFDSFYKPKDWCSEYIDKTMMDAPWVLGIQLKNIVAKFCASTPEIRIRKIVDEIPKNLTECFNLQSMGLTEGQLDEKKIDINNHLHLLINQAIGIICKKGDQEIENNNPQEIIGNPSNNQRTHSQHTSPKYVIPGPTTEADKLPTLNQVIENAQKRDDILTQQQVTNDITDEFKVSPQGITPSSSHNLVPPKHTGGNAFEFTDQGQIYHRPQTLPEAENTADSLIDALINSRANARNPQVIEDYGANGYHRTRDYNSFGPQNQIYETSRQFGQPQGPGYYHPEYIPSSSVRYVYSGHTLYGSHGSQNWGKPSNQPFNYSNEPSSFHRQNTGYDHLSPSDSESFSQYQARIHNGYSRQQIQYNKPLNYAHTEVVAQNFETAPDFEPKRSDQTVVGNPVRHVYSGVKGRRRFNSLSNPPASPQVEPLPVDIEPIAIQRIVTQDTAVTPGIILEQSTPLSTTSEGLPWWKRFGNKVKQGAADLKKKIIG